MFCKYAAKLKRKPMQKYGFKKMVGQLYWYDSPAWVFSWTFDTYLLNTCFEGTSGVLILVFVLRAFFTVKNPCFLFYLMNFFHSYLSIGQSNQRWWWCHSRNKSWSHKKLEKSCRGISRIGLLIGPYFMAHVIMMNVCNTVFVKCAMSYCKPYIVLLNVLSWCYILSIRFFWNLLPWCSKFLFYWNFVFNFFKVVS